MSKLPDEQISGSYYVRITKDGRYHFYRYYWIDEDGKKKKKYAYMALSTDASVRLCGVIKRLEQERVRIAEVHHKLVANSKAERLTQSLPAG